MIEATALSKLAAPLQDLIPSSHRGDTSSALGQRPLANSRRQAPCFRLICGY
jgi:hypothetical protein